MSSEWFIMRVDPHEGHLEWPQYELPISPAQAALEVLSQEEMDLVACLRGGLCLLTSVALSSRHHAEELHELAEALKPEVTT